MRNFSKNVSSDSPNCKNLHEEIHNREVSYSLGYVDLFMV